jgi:5-methylcytosine-specific restriction endonuclease McrA
MPEATMEPENETGKKTARRGLRGGGSVYQRKGGRWVAEVPLPAKPGERRRVIRYAKTEADAEAKRLQMLAEFGLTPKARDGSAPRAIRARNMEAARRLGTHTASEWYAVLREHDNRCYYCGSRSAEAHLMLTKDHKTPITRGGSDAIDNILPACKRCNSAKHDMTLEEFLADESREVRHRKYQEAAAARRRFSLSARGRPLGR